MAKTLDIAGLQSLIDVIGAKAIGDDTLPYDLLRGSANKEIAFTVTDITFSVTPAASASVSVFNSEDDIESAERAGDTVIVRGPASDQDAPPQVVFDKDAAWMKYQVDASVKASGGQSLSGIGFEIEGERQVVFGDYRHHPDRRESIGQAFREDLSDFRLLANVEDVAKLRAGEALAYQLRGNLSLRLETTWGEVLTANLSALSSLLRSNQLLSLKVSAGAKIGFTIRVSDDFVLIVSRAGNRQLRMAVKKSKSNQQGLSIEAGLKADFEDPQAVAEATTTLLEGLAGAGFEAIERLANRKNLKNLSGKEQDLLDRLFDRFGLEEVNKTPEFLKPWWTGLQARVQELIVQAAKKKISATFTYEYLRIKTESTLLQAVVPDSFFSEHHSRLLRADLSSFMGALRSAGAPITVEKLLHQKKLTRKKTWGFSLGIADWSFVGKDSETLEEVVQRQMDGSQRISFLGQRGYEGRWIQDTFTWIADFDAQMTGFSPEPTADQFRFGLRLKWSWSEKALTEQELRECVDHASTWRALDEDDEVELKEKLEGRFGQKAQVDLELHFDDTAFRALLTPASAGEDAPFAAALAAALPRWEASPARSIIERRTRLYTPLWLHYLGNPQRSLRDYARAAKTHLSAQPGGKNIATAEGVDPHLQKTFFKFTDQIRLNGSTRNGDYSGTARDFRSFTAGARLLREAIDHRWTHTHIQEAFRKMRPLWTQSLHMRALGVYLLALIQTSGVVQPEAVERSFKISFGKTGETLLFTTSQHRA